MSEPEAMAIERRSEDASDDAVLSRSKGTKGRKMWRYLVDEVDGIGAGTVEIGQELIEYQSRGPEHYWSMRNFKTGESGGFGGQLVGTGFMCSSCPNGIYGEEHACG